MKNILLLIMVIVCLLSSPNAHADNYVYDENYGGENECWLFDGYKCLRLDKETKTFCFTNSLKFAAELGIDCVCSFLEGDIIIPGEMEFQGEQYPVVEISTFHSNVGTIYDVHIPPSVKKISDSSFSCVDINNIYFSEGLETIGDNCFEGLNRDKNDPASIGITGLLLPESVKEIGIFCFRSCDQLIKFKLPSHITIIKRGCFVDLPLLSEIKLPGKLETIAENCFQNCESLSSITFPESIVSIGENCFYECKSLKSVGLPSHPVQMTNVFNYCPAIETVVCPSEAYDIDEDSFNEVDFDRCTLFVPKEYVEDFKQAKGWSRFKIIRGFDSGVDNVLSSGNPVRIEGRYVFADTDIEIYDNNGIRILSIAKDGSAQLDKGSYIWKSETDAGKFMVK